MLISLYYDYLFPINAYIKWLSYNNKPDIYKKNTNVVGNYLSRREISLTLENDIYIRYQTVPEFSETNKSPEESFKELLG